MFGWLRRRRIRRAREIFCYDTGNGIAYADPVAIDRELTAECADWRKQINFLTIPDVGAPLSPAIRAQVEANQARAQKLIVGMVRKVFGVEPIDKATGRGLSETRCFNLLADYVHFCGGLAEAVGPLSNSPAPAEASPPTPVATSGPSLAS